MGGVDNWILPGFNNDVQIKNPNQYVFQTLATNMRGFIQNARNGNSFAVANSELRFPIFKYFSSRPLRSDFLNNFQIIGFGDVGTAWTGTNPFSEDNSIFTTTISSPNNPVEITLKNQLNPLIGGYGWGIRSKVLGYFIRLDWAHGVQDGIILKRVFYISLNTDF
jgi:outer membrane protein assembly factor BamA